VFTAVGLARPDQVPVMVASIVIAVLVMMWLSGPISDFVDRHPTVKILALAFLILVGMALVAEGADFHIPKGYLYFAMAFSVLVEMVNLRLRSCSTGGGVPDREGRFRAGRWQWIPS
jgi:predicted tellurium resistance membrane protein TerC